MRAFFRATITASSRAPRSRLILATRNVPFVPLRVSLKRLHGHVYHPNRPALFRVEVRDPEAIPKHQQVLMDLHVTGHATEEGRFLPCPPGSCSMLSMTDLAWRYWILICWARKIAQSISCRPIVRHFRIRRLIPVPLSGSNTAANYDADSGVGTEYQQGVHHGGCGLTGQRSR